MPKEKQWLPPSPILGSKYMIDDILGPVFPAPPLAQILETESGQRLETESGDPIELEF